MVALGVVAGQETEINRAHKNSQHKIPLYKYKHEPPKILRSLFSTDSCLQSDNGASTSNKHTSHDFFSTAGTHRCTPPAQNSERSHLRRAHGEIPQDKPSTIGLEVWYVSVGSGTAHMCVAAAVCSIERGLHVTDAVLRHGAEADVTGTCSVNSTCSVKMSFRKNFLESEWRLAS